MKTLSEIAQELADLAYSIHGRDQQNAEKLIKESVPSNNSFSPAVEGVAIILYLKHVSREILSSVEKSVNGRQAGKGRYDKIRNDN